MKFPLMYDPRPYLERAKDALHESILFATSRALDTPKIPLDTYVDTVAEIEAKIDDLIRLVDRVEERALPAKVGAPEKKGES